MKINKKILIISGSALAVAGLLTWLYLRKKKTVTVNEQVVSKEPVTGSIHDENINMAVLEKKESSEISPNVTASLNNIDDGLINIPDETILLGQSGITSGKEYITGSLTEPVLGNIRITEPCGSYMPEQFPLTKCMNGDNIAELQKIINHMYSDKIGMTVRQDGYFGPQTEMAVKASFGVSQINYPEFIKIKLKYESMNY